MTAWELTLRRLRRRIALVLIVPLVAVAAAALAVMHKTTTYTARTALAVSSGTRSPDQDAVLARGYSDFFNGDAEQQRLFAVAQIPEGVTANSRLAVGSPIVYIDATSRNARAAADASKRLAETLRDEVRSNLAQSQETAIADLRRQLVEAQAKFDTLPPRSLERPAIDERITGLQSKINELTSDTTNQLQDLDLDANATRDPDHLLRILALALIGGLLLGGAIAVALGRFESRLADPQEVRRRLGVTPYELHAGPRSRDSGDDLAQPIAALASLVDAIELAAATSVAVVAPPGEAAAGHNVATALATVATLRGRRTLLVEIDRQESGPASDEPGSLRRAEPPSGAALQRQVLTNQQGLFRLPLTLGVERGSAAIDLSRIGQVLTQSRVFADLVVIDLRSPSPSGGPSLLGPAADVAIVVVEQRTTRVRDALQIVDLVGAPYVVGAVVTPPNDNAHALRQLTQDGWSPAAFDALSRLASAPPSPTAPRQPRVE